MEYLTGESLAERLKRGRLEPAEVDILRRRLAGGLGAAHEAGIIHRDVTPDNIILPGGDPARAKIIDFGIARLAETQTVIGDGFAGKYRYVSPEQLGLQGGEITHDRTFTASASSWRRRAADKLSKWATILSQRLPSALTSPISPALIPSCALFWRACCAPIRSCVPKAWRWWRLGSQR